MGNLHAWPSEEINAEVIRHVTSRRKGILYSGLEAIVQNEFLIANFCVIEIFIAFPFDLSLFMLCLILVQQRRSPHVAPALLYFDP